MKSPYFLTPIVLGVAAIVATPFQSAQALSATEVGTIAEAVTVRIDGQNSGSGVIIKRQGKVYTVLTAAHVVATEDGYDVVTPDGQFHELDYSKVKKLPNVDLALVEFTSPKTYKVADIGDSTAVKAGASIYVSGFPLPTAAITESVWNFSEGKVTANSKRLLADGYALIYSNDTLPGMSGGAVLNSEGKLIAIHGRADAEQSVQKTETVYQKTGFNLGIPINTFLNLAANVSPNLGFVGRATESTGTTLTKDDWLLQGVGKYRKGNYKEAIKDFGQAIAIDPKDAAAHFNRGNAYDELNQYNLALKDYSQAIQINPEYSAAYNNRGIIYTNLKQNELAFKDYSRAIQLNPEYVEAYANRGNIYNTLKQNELALKDYSRAIQLNPEYIGAYISRGNIYYDLKQNDLALRDYSRAIQLNPESAIAYNNRGKIFNELEQYNQAFKDLNRAIQLNPEYAAAYFNRGNRYYALKQNELALKDYSRAIQLNPEYERYYYNRGNAYEELKQYNLALKDYSQAIQINPEYSEAYVNRGITYKALNQYNLALKDYSRAIQLNPEYANAYNNRGVIYLILKQNELAFKDYSRVIQINPEYAAAYVNRGITHNRMGNKPQAKQDLKTAARLFQQQNNPEFYQKAMELLQSF
ncbi:serine protease [Acaryochloris marina]|uniref:tetratricopeptide repeat-containing S1 family peptidase n=1 Tax=Acaryochloris marina TaxID=155978 RepID=UPI001BAEC112|nr:serine protease [Acaryochloris marina]QUY46138.1 tetratricopeptide repeat protein [Acaryochloris marina S15]